MTYGNFPAHLEPGPMVCGRGHTSRFPRKSAKIGESKSARRGAETPPSPTPIGRCSVSKTIPLTRGYVTVVDDEDYEWLSQWRWCVSIPPLNARGRKPRAMRFETVEGKRISVVMARQILGILDAGPRVHADHINGDALDNRRANLRVATPSQNGANRSVRHGISKYHGVYAADKHWTACIKVNYKRYRLGRFDTEELAALAYDEAARYYFGEFATQNFPGRVESVAHLRRPDRRRITDDEVAKMRELYASGWTQPQIARLLGVHNSQVSRRIRGVR